MSLNFSDSTISQENRDSLGNYKNNRMPFFKNAISLYFEQGGELGIYIRKDAYTNQKPAKLLEGYFALITTDKGKSHSLFWRFIESLKEEK